jgi:KRAB domain-containing zinc finger protein
MDVTNTTIGFECDICLESCGSKVNLENHVKIHVKKTEQEVQISITGLAVIDQFKCGLCAINCINQADLSVHLQQHTGRKILVCEFCSYQSSEKLKMKIHSTIHKGFNPSASQSKSRFKCYKCNVAFKTKEKLTSHNYKLHLPTNQCTVCGYKFPSYSSLQKHIKSICSSSKQEHVESTLYDCTMCENQFDRIKDLKIHLMEHTSIPSKKCSICSKICVNQKALDRHTASIHA